MMTESNRQPDPLEELLAQVQELEEVGVFNRTPVDPATLVQASPADSRPRRVHRLFVALQAAACLALLVGVISLWRGHSGPTSMVDSGTPNTAAATLSSTNIAACMNGPAGLAVDGACEAVDYDKDGDVDLEDYGALQRQHPKRR
jgi:hypothetical protein